jgi:hypothetical protein
MGEEVPTLMDHLHEQFMEGRAIDEKAAEEDENVVLGDALPAFLRFAKSYLDQHRTVQTYPADANVGIVLANNTRLLIHPPSGAGMGGMQNSGAVDITEGQSQPGQEGVVPGDDKKII